MKTVIHVGELQIKNHTKKEENEESGNIKSKNETKKCTKKPLHKPFKTRERSLCFPGHRLKINNKNNCNSQINTEQVKIENQTEQR